LEIYDKAISVYESLLADPSVRKSCFGFRLSFWSVQVTDRSELLANLGAAYAASYDQAAISGGLPKLKSFVRIHFSTW